MKRSCRGARALLGLLLAVGVSGCPRGIGGGGIAPQTPPTFVLTWTDVSGVVNTLESRDGVEWLNPQAHQGALSEGGPAVGHDGQLTWLLAWPTASGLNFKVGVGGVPASGRQGGVVWEQEVVRGRIPAQVVGSPRIAFGGDRWLIAFRSAGTGLQVVRSRPGSVKEWEAPVVVTTPAGLARTTSEPALAYGNGNFVLAFTPPGAGLRNFTVIRSPDGSQWSAPQVIGQTDAPDPGLTYGGGTFLAVLSEGESGTHLKTIRFKVFSSPDGDSWSGPIAQGGAWDMWLPQGPGVAYGNGRLLLSHQQSSASRRIQVQSAQADDPTSPTSFTFQPSSSSSGRLTQEMWPARRTDLAFGDRL